MPPADAVDRDRLVRVFLELVAIDSPTGHEEAIGKELEGRFTELGCAVTRDEIGNLVAVLPGTREETVLLATHMDTAGSVDLSEDDYRAGADLLDEVRLTGAGPVGDRLWSRPSVSAIGIDTTSIAGSSNVLLPEARAKLSMRIVPGSDPERELGALVRHMETHAPWGAQVEVQQTKAAPPFRCETGGPGYAAARRALEDAYGKPAGEAGNGGSIPLLQTLQKAAPGAEFILWGPEDIAAARIHASDESVDPSEIERMVLAQAFLLQRLAQDAAAGWLRHVDYHRGVHGQRVWRHADAQTVGAIKPSMAVRRPTVLVRFPGTISG